MVSMNPSTFAFMALTLLGHMTSGEVADLTAAASEFSHALYQEIAVDKDNVVYSSFSIHACLSLASLGAAGATQDEMYDTLGVTSESHADYNDLITQTNSVTDVELYTANALAINPAFSISSDYLTSAQFFYQAVVDTIDFTDPNGPEKSINDFVSENTNNVIEEIIPEGTITDSTVLILVNTVFFNGTWQTQFSEDRTSPQDFYKLDGSTVQVDMMRDERKVKIKRNVLGADVAELPFKDPRFSLYIVLPRRRKGLGCLEKRLAKCGGVDKFFTGLESSYITLNIPKFKIENEFELVAPLKELGINQAFSPSTADFSGISTTGDLFISNVIHKAVIEVTETGTVAAAATAIIIRVTSIQIPVGEFIADHPFLFYLRDNDTGNILFQGKYSG